MIDRFQAANPDINIVYQYFPYDGLDQQAAGRLQLRHRRRHAADVRHLGDAIRRLRPARSGTGESRRGHGGSLLRGVDRRLRATTASTYGMPKEYNLENGCMLVNPAHPRGGRGDRHSRRPGKS